MKGIILAGGSGTRMHPMTTSTTKQLLPVYDKPLIYYPLATLIDAGVNNILIISQTENIPLFSRLFGDGEQLGIQISYAIQNYPRGIAEALIIARDVQFWEHGRVVLILGDNIYDHTDVTSVAASADLREYAAIFSIPVTDPQRYGVLQFDEVGHVSDIIEKPQQPPSRMAVTGLYSYPEDVFEVASRIRPSSRGELEITDINRWYLRQHRMRSFELGHGGTWLDAGTPEALLQASQYVQTIQERQGRLVGCPELAALRRGYLSVDQILDVVKDFRSDYANSVREAVAQFAQGRTAKGATVI